MNFKIINQNALDGIVYICIISVARVAYSYFLPWYWNKTASCKNGEEELTRMREALFSRIV